MLKKRILSVLLCLCMVVGMLPLLTQEAKAIGDYGVNLDSYYYNGGNPFSGVGNGHECTWYCWGRAMETSSVNLPCRGNANTWYDAAQNAIAAGRQDFSVGTVPRAKSILVTKGLGTQNRATGHVRFIESIQGTTVCYSESNNVISVERAHYWQGTYNINASKLFANNPEWAEEIVGYIYLGTPTPSINIGNDFYAYIRSGLGNLNVENASTNSDYGNVQTAIANVYDPRQIWHFIWDSNRNAYSIVSMYDGRYLDVLNGKDERYTNIGVCDNNGGEPQRWRIVYEPSGQTSTFNLLPYYTDKWVMDVTDGSTIPGANIRIDQRWQNNAQRFSIVKISNINTVLASDLGSDFYAQISYNGSYLEANGIITEEGHNMDIQMTRTSRPTDPKQIWHFHRESTGAYTIRNEYNGWYMDVPGANAYNKARVRLWCDDPSNTIPGRRWYLLHSPGDAPYRFVSAIRYPGELYSIDIPNGSTYEGANIEIYQQNANLWQYFNISKVSYTNPGKPSTPTNIQVTATSSGTTITWDAVPLANQYDSRKYQMYLANDTQVLIPLTTVTGVSYASSVVLPNDEYFVGVRAINTKYPSCYSSYGWLDFSVVPATHTVSVNATEGGTANGGGTYQDGADVTVTAVAYEGYEFKGWTENGSTIFTETSYQFVVNTDRTLTAVFEKKPEMPDPPAPATAHSISVSADPVEGGTVSGGGTYQDGAGVTVTATANTGYQFVRWAEGGNEVDTNAAYNFTADADRTLTAVFKRTTTPIVPSYTVSVSATPVEGGTISGGNIFQRGASATVAATPANDYRFVCWRANDEIISFEANYTFNVDGDIALTAVFEPNVPLPVSTHTISVSVNPAAGGDVSGDGSYQTGDPVIITAIPNDGYQFVEWRLDGRQISTTASYTFSANADQTYTAIFEEQVEEPPTPIKTYTVSVSASPSSGGTVTGSDSYVENASITVTAVASSGYRFVRWTEGGVEVDTSASHTFIVTKDRTLVAEFTTTGGSSGDPGNTPSSPTSSTSSWYPTTQTLPVKTENVTNAGAKVTETIASPSISAINGRASITISSAISSEIVKQATVNNSQKVIIAPKVTGSVTKAEVSIPASTAGQIGNQSNASLTISTPVADVTIPNGGLSSLSSAGGTVSITAEKTGNIVELSVTAGGRTVESIPGGLTLTVPTTSATPGTVAVLVRDNGTRDIVRKSVATNGSITIPLDGCAKLEIVDNSKYFADVPSTSWAADAVAFVSSHELFNGTSATQFSPAQPMSRGMLAVVLHNLESNPAQTLTGMFADVSNNEWYVQGVTWAASNGIVSGYGNGLFGPNDNITREQLAVMLWRYVGEPAATDKELYFTDADTASSYAVDALRWATGNGIINGKGGGILDPRGQATRAEVAQMLMNYLKK